MLIDSHAHIDSPRYAQDRAAMLARAFQAGIGAILAIGIGEGPSEMHQARDLCRQFSGQPGLPRLFASAGVYPHSTPQLDAAVLSRLDTLLAEPEVIACGEIGLDYFHPGASHPTQRAALIQMLEVAAARRRPILIHCRGTNPGAPGDRSSSPGWQEGHDAWNDLFQVLEAHWRPTGLGGVMHCFGAGWNEARRSLDLGFLVSFAGNLTFPKAQSLRHVAAQLPLDSLLVETDAPWLAPAPRRGQRNEPAWVSLTAETLATLKALTPDEIASATTKNFLRLFDLAPDVGNC